MVFPKFLPPYLTVIEVRAESVAEAALLIANALSSAGEDAPVAAPSKARLYHQIADVPRSGAP